MARAGRLPPGPQVWLDDTPVATLEPAERAAVPVRPPDPPGAVRAVAPTATATGSGAATRVLRYLPEWTESLRCFPVSPRLPLSPADQLTDQLADETALFFEALLPLGAARKEIAQARDADPDDPFTLLQTAGEDLPGAIRCRGPEGERASGGTRQRQITSEEVVDRLHGTGPRLVDGFTGQSLPWWPGVPGPTGEPPALGVYLDQDQWWWTQAPQFGSTHLLLAAPPGLEERPWNQYFCMRLAARLGMDVAATQLLRVPLPVLQVARVDRQRLEDGRVHRRHLVTAAQALGLPTRGASETAAALAAYADTDADADANGMPLTGPAWSRLGGLFTLSPQPLVDCRSLLRWWVFQVLTGHVGARPEELLFHLDHAGLRLAPAMRFLCPTAPGGSLPGSPQPSKGAGGRVAVEADTDGVVPPTRTAPQWAAAAASCGTKPRSAAQALRKLCENAPAEARSLAIALADEVPAHVSLAIIQTVTANSEVQLALLDDLHHMEHRDG